MKGGFGDGMSVRQGGVNFPDSTGDGERRLFGRRQRAFGWVSV